MSSYLDWIQGTYSIARCALAYGQAYLADYDVNYKVSEIARGLLFTCDVANTAYLGWKVHHKYQRKSPNNNQARFNTDFTVNMALIASAGAVFVFAMNRLLIPKINPIGLLEKTQIPPALLNSTTPQLDQITAYWTKTTLENLTTGLFFVHTVLDLCHAYLSSSSLSLINAAIHAMTLWKVAQFRTLAVKHSYDFLGQRINCLLHVEPGLFHDLTMKYFFLPVKKVESVFYLNTEGLSESSLIQKIQAIYDYSTNMFDKSIWSRYWGQGAVQYNYFTRIMAFADQQMQSWREFYSWNTKLIYKVELQGNMPPVPVEVKILHEDTLSKPFTGIEVFSWIPRFWIPEQKVPYSAWVNSELTAPLPPILQKALEWLSKKK
jgi:hypothetical protein